MISDVDGADMAVLGSVQVDALRRSVAEIPGYSDGAALKVDVLPLEGAALTPPDASVDHIPHIGHFEEAVEDCVDFNNGRVSLALGLNGQQQGGDLSRGDLRELKATEGWIYPFLQATLVVGAGVLAHGDRS